MSSPRVLLLILLALASGLSIQGAHPAPGGPVDQFQDKDSQRAPGAGSNQCPALAASAGAETEAEADFDASNNNNNNNLSPAPAGQHQNQHNRVLVDPATGQRSFQAKIVGIFSCFDGQSSPSNDLTLDFRLAKPVIDLAVQAVNLKYDRIRFNVTYRTAPDICKHQQAAGHAADEYYVNGANYFLGPGCSESLASVGQLASYWNVPMCSTGYLPEMITARFKPLTLMQLSLSVQSVGEMLLELCQMYKWRHLVIVTDEKHPLHSLIRDGLLEFFHTMYMLSSSSSSSPSPSPSPSSASPPSGAGADRAGAKSPYYINITSRGFTLPPSTKLIDFDQVMLEAATYSRIMLLLARGHTVNRLLEAAHRQGMSRGQFVFIAHELFESHELFFNRATAYARFRIAHSNLQLASKLQPKYSPPAPNNRQKQLKQNFTHQNFALDDKIDIFHSQNITTDQMREIFQPLMTISLKLPTTPEFDHFRDQVVALSKQEFNYSLDSNSLPSIYSLGVAAFIFDCVMLYAEKVNYVLQRTKLPTIDGKTIFDLAAGHTYFGAMTGNLTINRAGQRVIDFTLNDFSPENLTMQPIAHFGAIERRLNFLHGKAPHWSLRNQSTPRSDPRCRLSDNFCRYNEDPELDSAGYSLAAADRVVLGVWLVVSIVLSVGLTSSAIGWLIYRRFRIESELLNLWWSIKFEDIIFEDDVEALCDGKRSMSSLAISNESFNETSTGTHRGAGQASPSQQQQQQVVFAAGPDSGARQQQVDAQSATMQLSVCHSLGQDGQVLSAAHSTSTLSVGGASAAGATSGTGGQLALSSGQAAGEARGCQTSSSKANRFAMSTSSGGASKLIPLISKSGAAGSRQGLTGLHASGSAGGSGKAKSGGLNPSGSSSGGAAAAGAAASNTKDPSISSQNKNAKLRLGTVLNGARDQSYTTRVGLYKASRVAAKHLNVKNLNINRQLLIELRQVRDLTHENLIKFIGLCPEEPNVAIVSELCTRGNLQDLLQNETIRLDWPFRFSIINDIVDGLNHLHSSPVQFHGRLKSSNCVIDNRFVVKLTNFGLPTLLAAVELDENVNPRLLLWTAPEHLRTKHPLLSGSQKGDIYSLAIIFQEIITRCGPFECEPILCGASEVGVPADLLAQQQLLQLQQQQLAGSAPLIRTTDVDRAGQPARRRARPQPAGGSRQQQQQQQQQHFQLLQPVVVQHKQRLEPEEIVNLVRMGLSPPFRPYFRPDVLAGGSSGAGPASDFNVADLIAIVQCCWQEAPASRPTVASVKQQIKKMRRGCHLEGANLMDNLLQRMERYTDNLESLVEQKTAELMEEKKRSEELLYEMLPRFVVDQLKYGHSVTPEAYEAVTISFSDIKDFTSIAAQSSPIEVVNLLNQLYTEFDDCIARYDVYKVETIGDAYMVVSGLPVRNGDLHAKEIAEMSLALLDLIRNFDVAHLPEVKLELRIGIHSGPCASGVVGTRMFRYCLFGDTVSWIHLYLYADVNWHSDIKF